MEGFDFPIYSFVEESHIIFFLADNIVELTNAEQSSRFWANRCADISKCTAEMAIDGNMETASVTDRLPGLKVCNLLSPKTKEKILVQI